jgi:hypothetical protein
MKPSQLLMFVVYAVVAIFVVGTILSGFFQARTAEAAASSGWGSF